MKSLRALRGPLSKGGFEILPFAKEEFENEESFPMPYAIVILAFPRTDLPLMHAQGKILHGLFYELL